MFTEQGGIKKRGLTAPLLAVNLKKEGTVAPGLLPCFLAITEGRMKRAKALIVLTDLASRWSANLTTFSQAVPSAYYAPVLSVLFLEVLFFGLLPT